MKTVAKWFFSTTCSDVGLLILRLVIGASFIVHGFPKITGGMEIWIKLGGAMGNLGIHFAPGFWGFCAALAEFGGRIALVIGCLTRLAASGIGFTKFVASLMHVMKGDGFDKYSHPIELLAVCLLLLLTGAGKYSVDHHLQGK